jgi:hypothetical protein
MERVFNDVSSAASVRREKSDQPMAAAGLLPVRQAMYDV